MTTSTPTKPRGSAPKKGSSPGTNHTSQQEAPAKATRPLGVSRGVSASAQKIVLYGPGGVGKSELASLVDGALFIDVEGGTGFLDVARVEPETFEELREAIRLGIEMDDVSAIVIDSFTKAEELVIDYTLRTVPHEKGHFVASIEGYGFGKGYTHVYETFLLLLQELDAAVRAGKNVVGICHDCTANVPNPAGEDWIRYEPRLQSPASGKGSIRHRVKEWCDHLFYIGFDTFVSDGGKAQGSGSRTIYPRKLPTHWAKSRKLSDEMAYPQSDATVWELLFEN